MTDPSQVGASAGEVRLRSLTECEDIIERGLRTFMEVGTALAEIRDQSLYKQSHGTFEDYCRERWKLSRKRAYDLMGSARAVAELSPIGDTSMIVNEAQARALAKAVNQLGPEVAAKVLERVAAADEAEEKRLTAKRIEEESARELAEAMERERKRRDDLRRQEEEQTERDSALRLVILPRLLADVLLPKYGLTGVDKWCAVLDWTTAAELASLGASIKMHGMLLPVDALPDGTLLDGKRRLVGAWLADLDQVQVRTIETDDTFGHSFSRNVMRRHLTEDQRADVEVRIEAYMKAQPDGGERYFAEQADEDLLAEEYLRQLESLHEAVAS